MLTTVGKEMLGKLYSDAESVKKMQAIVEVYVKRWEILASIIKDTLHQNGFRPYDDSNEYYTVKIIDEKASVVFIYDDGDWWRFGFMYKEGTSKKIQKSLEDLLKNYQNKLLLDDTANDNKSLIYRSFEFEIDQPINDIVNTILKMYKDLEKMAADALK